MFTISRAPASASSDSGGPGCQMSSQIVRPDLDAVDLERRAARARLEVAQLVEHAVVGQVDLAVARLQRAVGEDRGRVVDVLGALGVADDRDDAGRGGGEAVQRRARVGEEVLLEQQVLGRVARQRELREAHELRAGVARLARSARDPRLVAGDVADDGVELGERDAQRRRSSRASAPEPVLDEARSRGSSVPRGVEAAMRS